MTELILWFVRRGGIPCLFHEWTGLYCPGCGGTRAVKALLGGHPLLSFLYHPVVPYCAVLAVWFLIRLLVYRKTGDPKYRPYLENGYVYAGAGIIVINFIVKNYLLLAEGLDVLALLPAV